MVNVNANLSSVSKAFDLRKALLSEAMPCGISSLLFQVTVVPAFTVNVCGVKVKLSIDTVLAAASCAQPGSTSTGSKKGCRSTERSRGEGAADCVRDDQSNLLRLGAVCR
jgi:hypothetical protein